MGPTVVGRFERPVRLGWCLTARAAGVARRRMGNMRWPIPRVVVAVAAVLFAILVVSLVGPADLNVMLIVAIVVPVAVIGALELPRLFHRHS